MRHTAILALLAPGCSGIRVLFPGETAGHAEEPGSPTTDGTAPSEPDPTIDAGNPGGPYSPYRPPEWGLTAPVDDDQGLGTGAIVQFQAAGADWVAVGLPANGGAVALFPWGEPNLYALSDARARFEGSGSSGVGTELAVIVEDGTPVWLAIGAPNHEGKGAVFLVSVDSFLSGSEEVQEDHTLEGNNGGDLAGSRLLTWDMDGDGVSELIVANLGVAQARGEVRLLPSATFEDVGTFSDSTAIQGDERGDRLGSSVAAGDVDGDGRAELLICAPGWTDTFEAQGACILTSPTEEEDEVEFEGLRGSGQPLLMGASENAAIGETAALLADLDEDGRAEIIVGSPTEGSVSLWWGGEIPLIGTTADAPLHIEGEPGTGGALFAPTPSLWVMTPEGVREFVDLPARATLSTSEGRRLPYPRKQPAADGRAAYGGGTNGGLFFGFPGQSIGVHGYPVDIP